MPKLYFEDFRPGETLEFGPRLVSRKDIIAFASEFDPQPMHLDEAAGQASMLGGLAASGWHTCCLMMRMMVDGFMANSSSMGAPGIDEVRWLAPLRPDTQIRLRVRIVETRASRTKGDRGFVTLSNEILDEQGGVLMTLKTSLMFGRRTPEAA